VTNSASVPRRARQLRRFIARHTGRSTSSEPGGNALVDFVTWWLGLSSRRKAPLVPAGTEVGGGVVAPRSELEAVVDVLATALAHREDPAGEHTRRVTALALALASAVAPELANDSQLRYGFLLHDIGLVGVPDSIVRKGQGLTAAEASCLEEHPMLGAQIIAAGSFFGERAWEVVAFHHERWDGAGYPWGLAGERIPLAARIFAVADRFESLTCDRGSRRALSVERALDMLRADAGLGLDPRLVERFEPLALEVSAGLGKRRRHLRAA
jgi:HD-GYP domain-containing protein (c-di-GMP phosphodiesterase class II)